MKRSPKIAIVGRPNVGKSALFNKICGKRIAIVDEAEGVTRDRLYAKTEFFGKTIEVVDTGGIDANSKALFNDEIKRQAEIAIEEADSLILVVDGTVGVTTVDEQVAKILLRTEKPVCLAVNKVDDHFHRDLVHQFYSLGISEIIPVSATHGFQITELLEAALSRLTLEEEEREKPTGVQIAIVGRPNVGKSTLINYLLHEERCVVSPIPGTTRDSIDAKIEVDGREFCLIDTAGIRRKRAEHDVIEKFAAIRTERALERAEVCLLMLDAVEGMSVQDKRIAHKIEELGKGCILLFNKWDLVKGFRMEHCLQAVHQQCPFLAYCPTLFISANTGRNIEKLFPHIVEVHEQMNRRVTTGQLNKFLEKAQQKYHPPMIKGKRLRIYYAAQIDIQPPRFVLFVNKPELMVENYKKYLINQFREEYGFSGVPLSFSLRGKKGSLSTPAEEEAELPHPTEAVEDTAIEDLQFADQML